MKHVIAAIILSLTLAGVYSQNSWASWDERYKETDLNELISYEEIYADSVNKGLIAGDYYVRMDAYRFLAQYTGKKRKISDDVKSSMYRTYKLTGDPAYLPILKKNKNEYQFMIEGKEYWFPVQKVLEKSIKQELTNGTFVVLYCLFLNEHTTDGILYNHFLISEFRKTE